MIVDRYLAREILKPLLVISGMLILIFASFSWVRYLGRAVDAQLPTSMIFTFIVLKVLIALEVLLPVALLLSVVVGLGRLHAQLEITALAACGVSPYRTVKVVGLLGLLLALCVSSLSLAIRPWAYTHIYDLEAKAETGFRISDLEAGRFYEREHGDSSVVIFMKNIDHDKGTMQHVFVYHEKDDAIRILSAQRAYERPGSPDRVVQPVLVDGYEYRLLGNGELQRITEFNELTIFPTIDANAYYTRRASPTPRLVNSSNPKETAELHWRLSTGLSTLLLALLGIPLSRATPRHGKYAKVVLAVIVFALYYNVGAVAISWVEQGIVHPRMPGIWWVNGCLALLLLWFARPWEILHTLRAPGPTREAESSP